VSTPEPCIENATKKRDMCFYNNHVAEVVCGAEAREQAFEECKEPPAPSFGFVDWKTGGTEENRRIEQCVQGKLRNSPKWNGDFEVTWGLPSFQFSSTGALARCAKEPSINNLNKLNNYRGDVG